SPSLRATLPDHARQSSMTLWAAPSHCVPCASATPWPHTPTRHQTDTTRPQGAPIHPDSAFPVWRYTARAIIPELMNLKVTPLVLPAGRVAQAFRPAIKLQIDS